MDSSLPEKTNQYAKEYGEKPFWKKVGSFAAAAGKRVIQTALILYYCLQDADTPAWAKTVIISSLGYFILPADAIPDIIAAVGYADDLGALASAAATIAAHIKPEHRDKAEKKLKTWFG